MKEVEYVAVDSINNQRGKITSLGSIFLPKDSQLTPQRSQAVDCIMCCNWNNGGHLARKFRVTYVQNQYVLHPWESSTMDGQA